MRRTTTDMALLDILRQEDVAGDESCGDAEMAQRLDHEQRVVAAGPATGLQGVERMLRAQLVTLAVLEPLADAVGHAAEDLEGRRWRVLVEKAARPFRDLAIGIGILRRDVVDEVGKFLVVIGERI